MEEHRTGGRSGRRWSRASTLPRYCVSKSLWSRLSCDEILTRGRNRKGQGSRAAGGGAPGWRPRPFGLVGAGSGVGVGRRGDYLRGRKKNSIEHSVPCPTRSIMLFFCISNLEKKLRESNLNTKIADSTIFIKYGGNLSEGSYEIV